jgi:FAD/FMN-containing dehydrogenase
MKPHSDLIGALRARLGSHGVLTDPADTAPYCEDWRRLYRGRTPAVLRPATTSEVADAVRLCGEHGVAIVPQGGNTSMVGGAAVSEDGSQILLSLSRIDRVRAIDPVDMTMEIEAGVTLKAAQDAAADADCLLPLSISSEGSAQIGGVLATNAGGNNTVRSAMPATWCSASKWYCRTGRSGTGCAGCTRTIPAIACASSLSAARARSASSPRPC